MGGEGFANLVSAVVQCALRCGQLRDGQSVCVGRQRLVLVGESGANYMGLVCVWGNWWGIVLGAREVCRGKGNVGWGVWA